MFSWLDRLHVKTLNSVIQWSLSLYQGCIVLLWGIVDAFYNRVQLQKRILSCKLFSVLKVLFQPNSSHCFWMNQTFLQIWNAATRFYQWYLHVSFRLWSKFLRVLIFVSSNICGIIILWELFFADRGKTAKISTIARRYPDFSNPKVFSVLSEHCIFSWFSNRLLFSWGCHVLVLRTFPLKIRRSEKRKSPGNEIKMYPPKTASDYDVCIQLFQETIIVSWLFCRPFQSHWTKIRYLIKSFTFSMKDLFC